MNELEKTRIHKPDKNLTRRLAIEVAGICINVLLAFICYYFHLPLYMDTIGTILVASLAGALPGIVTAVATSFFCSFFNQYSLYYVMIGVLIAMCVSSYIRNKKYKMKSTSVLLIMILAFIGGGVGTLFQWLLLGGPQFEDVAQSARIMTGSSNVGYYMCSTLLNVVLNLLDKTASIVIAFMIIRLMPKDTVKEIWFSSWKQNPLTNEEVDDINRQSRKGGIHSLRIRIIVPLSFAMVTLTIIMAAISINLQFENTRNIQSTHSMLQNLQHLK